MEALKVEKVKTIFTVALNLDRLVDNLINDCKLEILHKGWYNAKTQELYDWQPICDTGFVVAYEVTGLQKDLDFFGFLLGKYMKALINLEKSYSKSAVDYVA